MANKTTTGQQQLRSTTTVLVFACQLVLVLVTALAIVSVSHHGRQQVGELERLAHSNAGLAAQASRLKLEYSTLTEYSRVEKIAARELTMQRISLARMVVTP